MKLMKKIGICTLYYRNRNYGANLQAYALRTVLETMGHEAEVIAYYNNTRLHWMLSAIKQKIKKKDRIADSIRIRNAAIDRFNTSIPHSELYYVNTIDRANSAYDCFVSGTDQVWNPEWINRYMSLEFVHEDKCTAAYAASTGKITLSETQQQKLRRALDHTQHISIREKESIPALQALTDKEIVSVLDPTMLLTAEEWDRICSHRLIQEPYLFCYFLGGNENLRKVARAYADARGLKLVTLPYLNAAYRKVDDGFGDAALYDVAPNDFLSLVKHAAFVMTDSFHAAVFSHLYERPFAVSGKRDNEMGCRMKSLTDLFGTSERYFVDHSLVTLEALERLNGETLAVDWAAYEAARQASFDFLRKVTTHD